MLLQQANIMQSLGILVPITSLRLGSFFSSLFTEAASYRGHDSCKSGPRLGHMIISFDGGGGGLGNTFPNCVLSADPNASIQ